MENIKPRTKVVLEGTIAEMIHNEYQRYLSVDDLITVVDSQQYLGSVTKDEAERTVSTLKELQSFKTLELTLLEGLYTDIFRMVRPVKEEEVKEEEKEEEVKADKEEE